VLSIHDVEYEAFREGSQIIDFMLGRAVVALGSQVYEEVRLIKRNSVSILTCISVGRIVRIVSVSLVAKRLAAEEELVTSLQQVTVTTPIAIELAGRFGGFQPATAIVVVLTGVFGAVVGPFILDKAGISSKIARGLAMGSAAHGVGTARAIELGAVEGAISGLSIGLMGLATAIFMPLLRLIL